MEIVLSEYQVFLFDFDGLLVDTEPVHYAAYVEMCKRRGCRLDWSLDQYCRAAHFKSQGMRDALYREFPKLQELLWEVLYAEKKQIYEEMLKEGRVKLMPGVEAMLSTLQDLGVKHAVVTNSPLAQIELIRSCYPLLQRIPVWLTREDYALPKPAPDGYLAAMERLCVPGDLAIGFEDSIKGLKSLIAAGARAVLVCPQDHPQMQECSQLEHLHAQSLSSIHFDIKQSHK